MRARLVGLGLLAVAVTWAGEKKPPVRSTENDLVAITATVLADREDVKQVLGSDLGGHYILVNMQVTPKDGQKVKIDYDDFLLRTDKDGEKTTPSAPSQIAGQGALVVTAGPSNGGGGFSEPAYGQGPYGPPIMGGGGIIGGGGGGDATGEARAKVVKGSKDKTDPMLAVLKEKILPEKETEAPVSGLLYFAMEKQKVKDLELIYTTPEGKLRLRFK